VIFGLPDGESNRVSHGRNWGRFEQSNHSSV